MAKNASTKTTRTFNKVKVTTDKGVLRLQFPTKLVKAIAEEGIKFSRYKSLGKREIDSDTGTSNRLWAEAIASRIQADIDHPDGLFDPTLAKYLDVKAFDNSNFVIGAPVVLTVGELWEDFLRYHLAGKAASTKHRYQKNCTPKIQPFWDAPINRETANDMRSAFLEVANDNTKLAMQLLTKAVDWAIEEEKLIVSKNPFKGIAQSLKGSQKRKNKVSGLPNNYVAFNRDEVNLILKAYLDKNINRKYHDFFKFKFLTGCRTGEGIALTWDDVKFKERVILFDKTHYPTTGLSQGTKTEDSRIFPMNSYLADWLQALKSEANTSIVFSGNKSKYLARSSINGSWNLDSNEVKRSKDGIVVLLAKQGKLQYLSPYNTRHTFINFCIDQGIDTITISDWCGNSDNVIEQVYRSRKRDVDIELLPRF
ncbi:MAG: site-specific integrase [Cyanobacteriota bacterium]|nr:site-specific integrase [Cyanobacteriota bacterium]